MSFKNGSHHMRFFNGNWLNEPNITATYAAGIFGATPSPDGKSAVIATSPTPFAPRAMIGGAMLTVELTSPACGVIGVRLTHFKGAPERAPHYKLACEPTDASFGETDGGYIYRSGELELRISGQGAQWEFFGAGGKYLTRMGERSSAYFADAETGKGYVSQQLDISVGECLYGLGERFGAFVKNGQTCEMWQGDGGTGSEQAYKNVPFYMSSRGYGVFVDSPSDVSFEMGTVKVERAMFSAEGETMRFFVIYGDTPADISERYTFLTGRPALPPAWSFGLWLSTSFTTDYDEKTVAGFIDGMKERDIPLSVFHFDCFWMKGNHWSDFEWDSDMFPDPAGMLARYKERGLHICVWINPYIAQQSRLFDEGMERGYFIKNEDGTVWQTDLWQSGMAIVDFTDPAACEWYAGYLEKLMDMGVDAFKTDFGERIPVRGVKYFDGSDPVRMHNYYTQLYNETVFRCIERRRGVGQAVLFARSGTAGGQQFPVHWGGDNAGNYPSMAETLRAGLSLVTSGYGFWSHDIGGFEATAPADLYKRWCAFGLLSSHSRLHGSSSYRVPWAFDDEASDVLRFFVKLKNTLMPYIYAHAVGAHETGVPLMRPMFYEFTNDPGAAYLDRQYMLGPSLLVAPVFSETGEATFYAPGEGVWTDILSGETFEGGRWYTRRYAYTALPLLARPNSLVPFGACDSRPDYEYTDGLTVRAYALAENAEARCELVNALGVREAVVSAVRRGNSVAVRATKPLAGLRFEYEGKTLDLDGKLESVLTL